VSTVHDQHKFYSVTVRMEQMVYRNSSVFNAEQHTFFRELKKNSNNKKIQTTFTNAWNR